jgi:hypothetical protein
MLWNKRKMISLLLLCDTVSVRALNNSTTLFRCTCFVVPNGILNNYFIQYLLGWDLFKVVGFF